MNNFAKISTKLGEEYASSLMDLTSNSKPMISMLTILAEENLVFTDVIVETIRNHINKVSPEMKLLALYLVDSIVKNVGGFYRKTFSKYIANMFSQTFKEANKKIRAQMYKIRKTWLGVFSKKTLYVLDVKINLIDSAWPLQSLRKLRSIQSPAISSFVERHRHSKQYYSPSRYNRTTSNNYSNEPVKEA